MGADVVNTVAAQIEQVRPIIQEIHETSDQISSLFKKNSKNIENLSRYLYRFPLEKYAGGTYGKYSANGGALPQGTGMVPASGVRACGTLPAWPSVWRRWWTRLTCRSSGGCFIDGATTSCRCASPSRCATTRTTLKS